MVVDQEKIKATLMWIFLLVIQLIPVINALIELEISFPTQHSWWQVSNIDGLLGTLPVFFKISEFQIPKDGFLYVTGSNVPDEGYRVISDANSLFLGGIDPGTHFWTFELRQWSNRSATVAETTLHVEVVVDPLDKRSPWSYSMKENEKKPLVLVNTELYVQNRSTSNQLLPVCYVTTTSGTLDGQRKMWLQIMGALNENSFHFQVKTFEEVVTDAPMTRALRELNVSLEGFPVRIPRQELSEEETTQGGLTKALLSSFYRQLPWARHDSRRISILDRPILAKLQPPYAARAWKDLVSSLSSSCADSLIVFSNARRLSDELLVLVARLAGARAIVMELANLHPTRVDVDILLSPSHFAKEHYSVVKNVRARTRIVLSTGVDILQFTPSSVPVTKDDHFIIGYIGRLATEKSLGILLAAVKILAPLCSKCRLRVIGNGPQKPQLKALAAKWGLLGTSVEFVNGIYNDEPMLVREYRKLHVFVSQMFTETLGLAVLEAMSVEIPVVGFISGGTEEFLEDRLNCIAVKKATATDFADSILTLVNDEALRLRLGKQARRTVTERFSTHKALGQYAKLYERAGRPLINNNKKIQSDCDLYTKEFCGFHE
ncbi:Alpha-D-kanosaminyltransferase [Phytophthora citrophthora]|uniref:Alpha-D-kanosaminyltransferase n=1 Tax=Phytophthora citrophthora TaxID=4793 RepID=A0AAD9G3I2_9STRA|nr:Alpha-D-kanosaminyltransferase [Phytophthora citrophthora]